jgi:Raf kinase inhibitor-like YbhB/YbcL family protein
MDLQHTMRCLIRGLPHLIVGGVPPERAGDDRLAMTRLGARPEGQLTIGSPSFTSGGRIPARYTADGEGLAPPLVFGGAPAGTSSLALIVEDPDAPTPNPFVHWLLYGIPPGARSPDEALFSGAHLGRNSMLRAAWAGCAPPKGDTPHRYHFQLFALDRAGRLEPSAGRTALLEQLQGHVLASARLIGSYSR